MITKERLKELFNQDKSVFFCGSSQSVSEITQDRYVNNVFFYSQCLSEMFETKEEAEWNAKTSHKRIENFEPLYYNDINQNYCYDYYFSAKNHHEYLIRVSGKDIILFWLNCDYKEYYKNTKEEYEKLVLKCVKLFLGEEE